MTNIKKQVKEMLHAIMTIEAYSGMYYETYLEDGITQDAILFNLIMLGEIASILPQEFKDSHPDIPWTTIIETRNAILPGKNSSNPTIIWDILHNDLWGLKKSLSGLLKQIK